MPEIRGRSLMMVIQAVNAEIRRLRNLPEEQTVPEDEVRLVDYENLAEELEELYAVARATESSLPPYEKLVR
jgi:hypothetical protein